MVAAVVLAGMFVAVMLPNPSVYPTVWAWSEVRGSAAANRLKIKRRRKQVRMRFRFPEVELAKTFMVFPFSYNNIGDTGISRSSTVSPFEPRQTA
jgi:hypothetical protein